jgi:WD40 repeat protein
MLARLHVARIALLDLLPIRGLQDLVITYAHPFKGKIVHRLAEKNTDCLVSVSHQLIATCSRDDLQTVRVLNIDAYEVVREHKVFAEVSRLVSTNGRLAACSADHVHVWDDCASDLAPSIINTGCTRLETIVLSDTKWLAVQLRSDDLRIWDTTTCTRTCKVHTDNIAEMLFLHNGMLATMSGTIVRLWDPTTGRVIRKLVEHPHQLSKLCSMPNGLLATACYDKSVRLWDPSTGACVREFKLESAKTDLSKPILQLFAMPQDRIAMSMYHEGLIVWDVPSGKVVREMPRATHVFWGLLDDGDLIEWSSFRVVVWDVSRGLQGAVVEDGPMYVQVVCGNRLVTDSISHLTVWE